MFIYNLMIKENLSDCNINMSPMKAAFAINMSKTNNYEKKDLYIYPHFIRKLIYFAYEKKRNIVFIVGQLSKYNTNLRKD